MFTPILPKENMFVSEGKQKFFFKKKIEYLTPAQQSVVKMAN